MMNMIELQDKLKNFSQEQLVGMMQQPTGEAPQFMVLSEITRRQKMQQEASKTPTQSVAQEAVAAAGVPQGGIADMARTLAPQTNVAQNTGAMSAPPQGMPSAPQGIAKMASGGVIKMAEAGKIRFGRDSLVQTPEPTVVTPPYDPTSVDRNPPPAQQVTPIDLNTYPAGKFGSPATVPLTLIPFRTCCARRKP
jgi:hypothetical protein